MDALNERWSLAADFFWLGALARAGGDRRLAADCYIVALDWLTGARERSPWRPPWLALA